MFLLNINQRFASNRLGYSLTQYTCRPAKSGLILKYIENRLYHRRPCLSRYANRNRTVQKHSQKKLQGRINHWCGDPKMWPGATKISPKTNQVHLNDHFVGNLHEKVFRPFERPAHPTRRVPAHGKGGPARQVPWPPVTGDEQLPGRRRDGSSSGEGPADGECERVA